MEPHLLSAHVVSLADCAESVTRSPVLPPPIDISLCETPQPAPPPLPKPAYQSPRLRPALPIAPSPAPSEAHEAGSGNNNNNNKAGAGERKVPALPARPPPALPALPPPPPQAAQTAWGSTRLATTGPLLVGRAEALGALDEHEVCYALRPGLVWPSGCHWLVAHIFSETPFDFAFFGANKRTLTLVWAARGRLPVESVAGPWRGRLDAAGRFTLWRRRGSTQAPPSVRLALYALRPAT